MNRTWHSIGLRVTCSNYITKSLETARQIKLCYALFEIAYVGCNYSCRQSKTMSYENVTPNKRDFLVENTIFQQKTAFYNGKEQFLSGIKKLYIENEVF